MPEPLLPVAVTAKAKADEDKMAQALSRLVAEDPTLRLENNAETHQLVLWCIGEAHRDLLLDRLSTRYGVAVETTALRVSLRETSAGKAQGRGRNVKQSGGHGEYAICEIEVEPLPSGSGLEFVDKIVGGVVPRQFIPSVEKGVRAQMEHGVVAGYPVVDLRVTLVDGKAHSVDSSDMAFQKAGARALRDAAERAQVHAARAGRRGVSARRGRIRGRRQSRPVLPSRPGARHRAGRGGRTLVKAEIPELELARYAMDLRSMSHGTGHSPGPTCATSRCPRTCPRRWPQPPSPPEPVAAAARAGHATIPGPRCPAGSRPPPRAVRTPGRGSARLQSSGPGLASISRVSARSSGSTLVRPTTGMKFASPPHRGTTC